MKAVRLTMALLGLAVVVPACGPEAAKRFPVTNTYHEVSVIDDYQWLEDWDASAVKKWNESQDKHARSILKTLPHVAEIHESMGEIMRAKTVSYYGLKKRENLLFALKYEPPKHQAFLILLRSVDQADSARVLVDPNVIDPKGLTTIDWFIPSPEGNMVAVSLSKAGTESGDVSIYQTETGDQVYEMIRVFTAITVIGVGDPGQLAGGISEALITTAAGLTVAIPSLIFYRHLKRKIDELVVAMEQEAMKLVEFLHGDRKKLA